MRNILTLLSTSFVLISAFEFVYAAGMPAFSMGRSVGQQNPAMGARFGQNSGPRFNQQAIMPQPGMDNAGGVAGGSLALFGKREAAAEQNALLRRTQIQIQAIDSNPTAKLAYLRSMRQGLGTKAEFSRVRGLPAEQRASELQLLYARLRAENQRLMGRQQSISGGLSMPGLPDFNMGRPIGATGDSVEADMNDIINHYKNQRLIATSSSLEVGPNDYIMNMRNSRTLAVNGRSEVGPGDVRGFMQQRR